MPAQLDMRETIQEYARSEEAKTIINDMCAEACAAHTRELASFIPDAKEAWIRKYKASVAAGTEAKGRVDWNCVSGSNSLD